MSWAKRGLAGFQHPRLTLLYIAPMIDLRLPAAQARERGLLPDLALIREHIANCDYPMIA